MDTGIEGHAKALLSPQADFFSELFGTTSKMRRSGGHGRLEPRNFVAPAESRDISRTATGGTQLSPLARIGNLGLDRDSPASHRGGDD